MKVVPTGAASLKKAINFVGNPRLTCARMFTIMQHFMEHIKELRNDKKSKGNTLKQFYAIQILLDLLSQILLHRIL